MQLLQDLSLKKEYRSDEDELASDFFVPCLAVSISYDRAVGYFTSSGLALAARGLEAFVAGEGIMRLVASPVLEEEDLEAILRGLEARSDIVERTLLRQLSDLKDTHEARKVANLAWLVAEERLEIRLAIPREPRRGIFHEKVGIFTDRVGDSVVVIGSANETRGGLLDNFEAVDVFVSWGLDASRVERKRANFERLWNNQTARLDVIEVPAAVRRELVRLAPRREPSRRAGKTEPSFGERRRLSWGPPAGIELRDYQRTAVNTWATNEYRGLLAMATATGKTITALWAAWELKVSLAEPLAIVILAPYIHLVDQWLEEARRWGLDALPCYESSSTWTMEARERADFFRAGVQDTVVFVATHATASLEPFQQLLESLPADRLLMVGDEAHHLGAPGLLDALPLAARYRIGLSATPERWQDEEGTDRLLSYFGGVVFEFGISEAIAAGCLTPYVYHPLIVHLEPDELEGYERVTKRIVAQLELPPDRRDARLLGRLMDERARVLDNARGKIAALRLIAEEGRIKRHSLVYCANRRQLAAVMDVLWDRGIVSRQFTGEEARRERVDLLSGLADGSIPALVAIRCLDEGVDVPEAREAYLLASSGNPRQFVQRRGRLLRLADDKDRAEITDFIVVPEGHTESEREMLRGEVRRVSEFADAALNGAQAIEVLWPLLDRFGLLHELGRE